MKVKIDTEKKKYDLGDLYGIFFEDLNHGADGGLYGEMVENRAFEFDRVDNESYHHLTGWEIIGSDEEIGVKVLTGNPVSEKNPHYLAVDIHKPGRRTGIRNAGYHKGMYFQKGAGYNFSCWAKREQDLEEPLCISLQDKAGRILAEREIQVTAEWKKYELNLTASDETEEGRLAVTVRGRGRIYLDFVSLFPRDTYRGRRGGLRRDLAELLEALHPKFLRFPGGCLTHDGALDPDARDAQYRWKNTVGPVESRPARRNNWGYHQTGGLGFYELFQLSEDIGAKPLPVLSPGYDPHHYRAVPLDRMQYFIDEALDLIEFANGSPDSKWGGLRAQMGHPKPFGLEYLGIGNEEVGEEFFRRYKVVAEAVRERYPEIKLVGTSGPFAAGTEYERGWRHAGEGLTDLVDEHYYMAPEWFVANHDRYGSFPEEGTGVFLGEYASKGNSWYNALCEASFMIGLEECAGAVKLACYAPLLCSADHVNWEPDMIWFDGKRSFGSANYYVQKLFMVNQGRYTLPVVKEGFPAPVCRTENPDRIGGKLMLGSDDAAVEYRDILLVNEDSGESFPFPDVSIREGLPCGKEWAVLDEVNCKNYSLTLKAVEKKGFKGFRIYFGAKDEKNLFRFSLGGWQNQDAMVTETLNGRDSDLTHCVFSVEREREYALKLQVSGRRIRTYIDGRLCHDYRVKPVITEALYITAAKDENEDILVKAVNLSKENRKTDIVLQGLADKRCSLTADVMKGWQEQDRNSFEEPEKISPATETAEFEGTEFTWDFPAESVTVLRIQERSGQ